MCTVQVQCSVSGTYIIQTPVFPTDCPLNLPPMTTVMAQYGCTEHYYNVTVQQPVPLKIVIFRFCVSFKYMIIKNSNQEEDSFSTSYRRAIHWIAVL